MFNFCKCYTCSTPHHYIVNFVVCCDYKNKITELETSGGSMFNTQLQCTLFSCPGFFFCSSSGDVSARRVRVHEPDRVRPHRGHARRSCGKICLTIRCFTISLLNIFNILPLRCLDRGGYLNDVVFPRKIIAAILNFSLSETLQGTFQSNY